MEGGTYAVLGSVLAFVIIFILGKRYGKSEQTQEYLNNMAQVAQEAATAKSEASAEVAQVKTEISQEKSEKNKAQVNLKITNLKAEFLQDVARNIIELVNKNEQTDSTMAELQEELETAKRYNNMDGVIEVAKKQAARAVEMGMTAIEEKE